MESNNSVDNQSDDWIPIIKAHSQAERNANASSPKYLFNTDFRHIIWKICSNLNVSEFGVPGYACRLIEHYMTEKVRSFLSQNSNNSWDTFREFSAYHLLIIMGGAIIISSQLHHVQRIEPIIVADFLLGLELADVTVEEINNAVNEVLEVHSLYLPLWTTHRMAELLAQHVGIPANMASFLRTLASKADLMAWQLNIDMSQIYDGVVLGGSCILSLHLAAGAVYATAKFFKFNMSSLLSQLATFVDASELYLNHLADFILHYYNLNQDDI